MITEFYVNEINELVVKATPDLPATDYEEALLWYYDTYKDVTKSIDLSSYLNNGPENFVIPMSDLGLNDLTGIFYLQLFDNSVVDFDPLITPLTQTKDLAVAANLSKVYNCFLDKLQFSFDGCEVNTCGGFYIENGAIEYNAMIEGVIKSLVQGEFTLANNIYCKLLDDCCNCDECDTTVNKGFSIGTFNDVITFI